MTQGGHGLQGWGGQGQVFTDSGDCETRPAPAVLHAQGSRAGRALERPGDGGKGVGGGTEAGGEGGTEALSGGGGLTLLKKHTERIVAAGVSPRPGD